MQPLQPIFAAVLLIWMVAPAPIAAQQAQVADPAAPATAAEPAPDAAPPESDAAAPVESAPAEAPPAEQPPTEQPPEEAAPAAATPGTIPVEPPPVVEPSAEPSPVVVPAPQGVAPAATPPESPTGAEGSATSDEDAEEDAERLVLPSPGQGHYLAVGLHYVAAKGFDPERPDRPISHGSYYTLLMGEAVTEWMDLGLQFSFGGTAGDDSMMFGRILVQGQFHYDNRLFIRGGFGGGGVGGPDPDYDGYHRGSYGAVYMGGIGANLFLSDSHTSGGWIMTPILGIEVEPHADFSMVAVSLGVEISVWSGLSRDKLDLPLDEAYDSSTDED